MRLVLVTLALGAVLFGSPRVDVDAPQAFARHSTEIEVSTLPEPDGAPKAPRLNGEVSAVALAFVPRLTPDTMPLMPDIPARSTMPWQDESIAAIAPPSALAAPPRQPRPKDKPPVLPQDTRPDRPAGKFITPPKPDAQITGNRLAVRTGPAKRFSSVGSLSAGDKVRITGERRGGYLPIIAANGQSGWVFHSYVRRVN